MIDWIKLKISHSKDVESMRHHPGIRYVAEYELDTSVLKDYKLTAKYKNLKVEYFKNVIYLSGSLYEYFCGLKNFQNFKIEDLFVALIKLETDLGIDLAKTEVIKLEWGLNIALPQSITAKNLIESVLVYKGKLPSHIHYKHGGLMRHFKFSEFEIKIYDKGAQHRKGSHLVRYEIVIRRKHHLARKGIKSAADLLDKSKLLKINAELIETLNHLIFYHQEIPTYKLTNRQKEFFLENNNSTSWQKLMRENPELYRKKKPAMRKLIKQITGCDWNEMLKDAIQIESALLFQCYQVK